MDKIMNFWDAQARKSKHLKLEGVANLEEDPKLLEEKIETENRKVMKKIDLDKSKTVLDLGAGTGQWSFRFAEIAKEVVAVEFSEGMCDLARNKAIKLGVNNIEFVISPVQNYESDKLFDLIFISGLLIYLDDEECELLASKCKRYMKPGGNLFLRDGTGVKGRHEINDKYSEDLSAYYSATYRSSGEYIDLFESNGFSLVDHEDMFKEGSPLNKWEETRLRIYQFKYSNQVNSE